jgi:hypothetical protein
MDVFVLIDMNKRKHGDLDGLTVEQVANEAPQGQ